MSGAKKLSNREGRRGYRGGEHGKSGSKGKRQRLIRLFRELFGGLCQETAQNAGLKRFASSTTRPCQASMLLFTVFRLIFVSFEVRMPSKCKAVSKNVIASVR